jgi:sulfur transfer complex TusBCD TusB component (DsrH family)
MKLRFILPIIISILIGYGFGKIIFNNYTQNIDQVFSESSKIYLLQQGVYSSVKTMENNTTKVANYIYQKDGDYYKTYVAITKDIDNVNKLKETFKELGNDIYVKEMTVNNKPFLDMLEQYDSLISLSNDTTNVLSITKQVLTKYKEMVVDSGSIN